MAALGFTVPASNTRYFKFPSAVTIKAREGWDNPRTDKDRNVLRTITGQKPYLDQHADVSGVHALSGAKVHWWILKDEPAITNNSGFIDSAGHVAALYQDELYDRATSRAGTAVLQRFGILFGNRNVVLYVEPLPAKGNALTTNTARTTLQRVAQGASRWCYVSDPEHQRGRQTMLLFQPSSFLVA
jgi:hypothetical protein